MSVGLLKHPNAAYAEGIESPTPPLMTPELTVKDALSLGFHWIVVEPFRITSKAGIWKDTTGYILVGSGEEKVRVPVRPFVHTIVDKMRITWPLAIRTEDTIHTGVRDMQYNFVDI